MNATAVTTSRFCSLNLNCSVDVATSAPPPPLPSPQWGLLALSVIPLWIVGGNGLVLVALLLQRHLQNMSNRVIASLAVTDFLLALVVVPLGIYQLVRERERERERERDNSSAVPTPVLCRLNCELVV